MGLFSSSKSSTNQFVTDNRIAATENATVIRGEGDVTVGFTDFTVLEPLLGFFSKDRDQDRSLVQQSLVTAENALAGTAGSRADFDGVIRLALIAGGVFVAVRFLPQMLKG